jgi:hypothetical protein
MLSKTAHDVESPDTDNGGGVGSVAAGRFSGEGGCRLLIRDDGSAFLKLGELWSSDLCRLAGLKLESGV